MKRWIPAMIVALICHAVLFKMNSGWTRPALSLTENRAVTLSLVQPTATDAAQRKMIAPIAARPLAPVAPLAPLPPPEPTPPEPSPHGAPETISRTPLESTATEWEPADQPMDIAPEPTASKESTDDRSSTQHTMAEETNQTHAQEALQASVPLYHLNPAPDYPALARRRGYQGTVLLDVLVDRSGRAIQVRVANSTGFAVLDRSALASVRQWRFEPARRMGRPVEMWVQVPVRFALQ